MITEEQYYEIFEEAAKSLDQISSRKLEVEFKTSVLNGHTDPTMNGITHSIGIIKINGDPLSSVRWSVNHEQGTEPTEEQLKEAYTKTRNTLIPHLIAIGLSNIPVPKEIKMPPYQQRVLDEQAQLWDRTSKLEKFIYETDIYNPDRPFNKLSE